MDALTKLSISIYLCKRANETHIDDGKAVTIDKWDSIGGIPEGKCNQDYTDVRNPNAEGMPTDIGVNNKQLISGTGNGHILPGRWRNNTHTG